MSHKKSVIALLIHSLSPGGMERVMTELGNYFVESGNMVHLIMYGKSPKLFYKIDKRIVVHSPDFGFNDKFRFFETIKRIVFLRKNVKELQPDCVLTFGTHWNNFVLLALLGLKYPIYVSDRGSPIRNYSLFHRTMRKLLYKTAAGIIAQTELAMEITLKIIPSANVKVIGNPIRSFDGDDQGSVRENIIITVGRLIDSKHHDRLIHIFSKIDAPDWKLVIVGGNALKQKNYEKLQRLISDLNLTGRVILTGEKDKVEEYYLKSRIFAFTSSVEGFPNVIGEALSAALPVVSYDCVAGPAEMIQDSENGFLVPVFDDELFRQRLELLINDIELRSKMSEQARLSIRKFSIERIGYEFQSFMLSSKFFSN